MSRPAELASQRWHIAPAMPPELAREPALAPYHPILLQVLYNRGLAAPGPIEAFLAGHYLESTDPYLLADMEPAVTRIRQAIDQGETIVVYGDFDADGVTATVLLVEALRGLGLSRQRARPYIPDRVDEGYGLNRDALDQIRAGGADLVITVDCGIRAFAEAEHARDIGLDLIVSDHHSLGRRLPEARAVINPKRPDSSYPETMLAGVGIAYKLAEALFQAVPDRLVIDPAQLLDLVAIGTVADLAPLMGENRRLVQAGLAVLNEARRPGVAALAEAAGLRPGQITAESIAFGLGPRINAAGRLAHAYHAARLLAVNNLLEARPLAGTLNRLNRERQQKTRELTSQAETLVDLDRPLLFVAADNFLPGVVGLVASRLAEKHYRPAVVVERGSEESRGSCRSIAEFHITEALDDVGDLLEHYGGHAMAAGLTVRNENLPALEARLVELAAQRLEGLELQPTLPIDAEIALRDVDWALQAVLDQLEPTGNANPTPVFLSRRVQVLNHRAVGQEGAHLQLTVADGAHGFPAVAFRQGAWVNQLPPFVDLVYTVGVNEWRGQRNLQLMVQDIKASDIT